MSAGESSQESNTEHRSSKLAEKVEQAIEEKGKGSWSALLDGVDGEAGNLLQGNSVRKVVRLIDEPASDELYDDVRSYPNGLFFGQGILGREDIAETTVSIDGLAEYQGVENIVYVTESVDPGELFDAYSALRQRFEEVSIRNAEDYNLIIGYGEK